ncbi:hypothetical protein [Ideonella alba]|uniref:DUF4145 domain-containing protein n=1 Tax=Ideonella alba TaxID=2824118 RepID=A0A940Y843_9BURK|nr:hypothetical protein [Ideonella alba]MBQ0929423.1 hypothetical protein [Ideonella alba]
MAIENAQQLREAAERAGALLQEIQDYLAARDLHHTERPEAKVRFPRGFIRRATEQRARVPFIADRALKDNLAYTLILTDTILWLRLRTDLWGTPKEMLTKLYVFLVGTLVESITKVYLDGICGKNFKKRNEYLVAKGIITEELQADLDWLWDTRNKMHLFQLEEGEYENEYNQECHRHAVRTFRSLLAALSAQGHIGGG